MRTSESPTSRSIVVRHVGQTVLEAFDHKSMNEDVAAFRERVPTTENLCIEIYERLKNFPYAKLERVRIEETSNNSFEYAGEAGVTKPRLDR